MQLNREVKAAVRRAKRQELEDIIEQIIGRRSEGEQQP